MDKKKIVVIGGGNGTAVVLESLKAYSDQLDLSAVVSMSDHGGSSGRLRDEMGVLPPGDILRAVLALSSTPYEILKPIFYGRRFQDAGKFSGHNLGNLFLALGEKESGKILDGLHALHEAVDAQGRVFPITVEQSDLCVELDNGEIVKGEEKLDHPSWDRSILIRRAWLEPMPPLFEDASKTIEEADVVVLGPGTLYGSIIAPLLVEGVTEALIKSKARLVYVASPVYEETGETSPLLQSERIAALEGYLPRPLDHILISTSYKDEDAMVIYKEKGYGLLTDDVDSVMDTRIRKADLQDESSMVSAKLLGPILSEFIS